MLAEEYEYSVGCANGGCIAAFRPVCLNGAFAIFHLGIFHRRHIFDGGGQRQRVAAGKNESVKAETQFSAALHLAGPLDLGNLTLHIRTRGNRHLVFDGHGKRGLQVNAIPDAG